MLVENPVDVDLKEGVKQGRVTGEKPDITLNWWDVKQISNVGRRAKGEIESAKQRTATE